MSFLLVRCKGLGTGIGCKPAHSGDRQGRKIRCLVWLPQWPAVLVFIRAPVVGPSVSNGNRSGSVCVLGPFSIRRVGASFLGEGMRTLVSGSTTVVNGH